MSNKLFNESHNIAASNGSIKLGFLESLRVKTFPCGRRRSALIGTTPSTQYHIPFDPEARLNTEATSRKSSGLNGFTQTYINHFDSNTGILSLVLAGYLFELDLTNFKLNNTEIKYPKIDDIVEELVISYTESLTNEDRDTFYNDVFNKTNKIYANIRIEKTALVSMGNKGPTYYTEVLRDQTNQTNTVGGTASKDLDLIVSKYINSSDLEDFKKFENYYFSGLSFSLSPITARSNENNLNSIQSSSQIKNGDIEQLEVSLCIFQRSADNSETWELCQEALLPQIKHGDLENSVKVDTMIADKIYLDYDGNKLSVPAIKVVQDDNKYQLQFFTGATTTSDEASKSDDIESET